MNRFLYSFLFLCTGLLSSAELKKIKCEETPVERWKKIIEQRGLKSLDQAGYIFVFNGNNTIFYAKSDEASLSDYDNAVKNHEMKETELKKAQEKVASIYKIHLMPKDEDMDAIFQELLDYITKNKKLQSHLHSIKIYKKYGQTMQQQKRNPNIVMPRIVIYPGLEKYHAQEALDVLYAKFKNTPGLNISPRYNAKLTDLIYVAQGDGDFKENYSNYFEQPKRVYYDEKMIPITAVTADHYLRHPETRKPLK
ncbi:MAG: hypothetical protein AB7R69_04155 [Candidatus Babeliales bacterium]